MKRIPLYEISGVAASGTATIHLDQLIGYRIHSIILQHGFASGTNTLAGGATNVSEIRFIVNDVVRRRVSGTQLRDLLLRNGTAFDFTGLPNTAPGVAMTIPFAEAWRQDRDQREITAFPTRWGGKKNPLQQVGGLRLEVALAAASTPTLVAYAVVTEEVPDVAFPSMIDWQPWSIPAGSTLFDYSVQANGVLVAAALYPDSGGSNAATRVKVVSDGETVHDLSNTANLQDLTFNGSTPAASGRTASVYDLVFDRDDNLARALPLTNRTVVLSITAGSAMSGTITAVAEVLKPIAG
jgi:hypothetical protein